MEYDELVQISKRKRTNTGMLPPADFETRQQKLKCVWQPRGTSDPVSVLDHCIEVNALRCARHDVQPKFINLVEHNWIKLMRDVPIST